MKYQVISADCHIDLIWLPPDLFTGNASAAMKDRMPHVVDSDKGPKWISKNGAEFGLANAVGSAGREYVPGQTLRTDRMAATGLYEDGRKGIRRLTEPELRIADQDRDGVQGEVIYGVLGASQRLKDPAAAVEVLRIYNEWLAGFCQTHPNRFAGIACIPNHDIEVAVDEIRRVAKQGTLRGIEVALTSDIKPLYNPFWNPLWEAANETELPVHFHTVGTQAPDVSDLQPLQQRQAFAVYITGFQIAMSRVLMELLYGGVFEAYPRVKVVLGESGIGWIPYLLEHMDLEWEERFRDLTLTMKPSEYWRRNCRATYQTDHVGIKLLDSLGEDTIMWGSDFPHPDGVWPDSQSVISRELGHLPEATRRKIVCNNAASLYGFV